MANSIDTLYGDLWGQDEPTFSARLDASLHPRTPTVLYDLFARLGVGAEDTVLDIGCRDAGHAVALVKRFGCRAVAIDPIPLHIELANRKVTEAGLADRITALPGRIEALPLPEASLEFIWCRDMLNHVDLSPGLAECFRALAPGGCMFIYQTFATELCEPKERAFLCAALALVPENMNSAFFEQTALAAGFDILDKDVIDSEWREQSLEAGEPGIPTALLHVSRMRRRREEWIAQHGRERYEAAYAGELWGIYQLLGKLCPTVHVLKKRERSGGP